MLDIQLSQSVRKMDNDFGKSTDGVQNQIWTDNLTSRLVASVLQSSCSPAN